jgi:hypothetical protein
MPATTMAGSPAATSAPAAASVGVVPFTRASVEHVEPFYDNTFAFGGQLPQIDIPAYGYVRGVYALVTLSGGVGTGVVAKEDAPWSVFQSLQISDVNGAFLYGPMDGYGAYLTHKFGGYFDVGDPKTLPAYSAVGASGGNAQFIFRVPVEIRGRDGLGCLPNVNASNTYKFTGLLAPSSAVYATAPGTTLPSVRIRLYLDAWALPDATDLNGNAQAQTPPALGTTQFWTRQIFNLPAGPMSIRSSRVGNLNRNWIFVLRDQTTGLRVTTVTNATFPDPFDQDYDTKLLKRQGVILWQSEMVRKFGLIGTGPEQANGLDNGVFVEDFTHDLTGHACDEIGDLWLDTQSSTRIDFIGNIGASSTLMLYVNDFAPVGSVYAS